MLTNVSPMLQAIGPLYYTLIIKQRTRRVAVQITFTVGL